MPYQADEGDITVTIKTEPVDVDDVSYMCDTDGMLQWHAQVEYSAAYAGSRDTTPAVLAAQANDYVAYSSSQFKALLAGFINAEVKKPGKLKVAARNSGVVVYPCRGGLATKELCRLFPLGIRDMGWELRFLYWELEIIGGVYLALLSIGGDINNDKILVGDYRGFLDERRVK